MYRVSKHLVFLKSFMYRYTQYTIHDAFLYRVPKSSTVQTIETLLLQCGLTRGLPRWGQK